MYGLCWIHQRSHPGWWPLTQRWILLSKNVKCYILTFLTYNHQEPYGCGMVQVHFMHNDTGLKQQHFSIQMITCPLETYWKYCRSLWTVNTNDSILPFTNSKSGIHVDGISTRRYIRGIDQPNLKIIMLHLGHFGALVTNVHHGSPFEVIWR